MNNYVDDYKWLAGSQKRDKHSKQRFVFCLHLRCCLNSLKKSIIYTILRAENQENVDALVV
jgi:hypothetical protein